MTDAFNSVTLQVGTVLSDQGGGASYNVNPDNGIAAGANTKIGFTTNGSNSNITNWLQVVNGNNAGQILVKGSGTGGGGCFAFGVITPAQITANQNDYTLTGMSKFVRLSTDASRNITGMRDPNAPLNGRQQQGEEKCWSMWAHSMWC